jgi:ATP-binding cassette, subfamily C (CFTR/MRP), member 1
MYERLLARLGCLERMALVGIIHNRCLTIKDGVFDDSAAVTLMSNDAGNAASCGNLFHELWSQVLELGIGMYMLARELGWVCIFPLLVVICMLPALLTSQMSFVRYLRLLGTSQAVKFITANLVDRQMAFSMATQMRISTTKAVLDSMKNIKMMGLIEKMEAKILTARNHEIKQYIAFYRLLVTFFVSCKWLLEVIFFAPCLETEFSFLTAVALHLFSPAITLIIYAIQAQLRGAKSIDVNMAFTSLAIIDIVSTPANTLLGVLPEAASVIAAFDRIQTYLLSPGREDKREFIDKRHPNGDSDGHATFLARESDGRVAININHVTLRPASTADPVLRNISTALKKGDLVVVSGAVGTGKTVLAKAILGDLPPDSGVIQTACGSMAYCSQVAWLINGTIKEAICGPPGDDGAQDEEWYKRVVIACDLEEDLYQMPGGDQTILGSRGITLSGGQKQRVVGIPMFAMYYVTFINLEWQHRLSHGLCMLVGT